MGTATAVPFLLECSADSSVGLTAIWAYARLAMEGRADRVTAPEVVSAEGEESPGSSGQGAG